MSFTDSHCVSFGRHAPAPLTIGELTSEKVAEPAPSLAPFEVSRLAPFSTTSGWLLFGSACPILTLL